MYIEVWGFRYLLWSCGYVFCEGVGIRSIDAHVGLIERFYLYTYISFKQRTTMSPRRICGQMLMMTVPRTKKRVCLMVECMGRGNVNMGVACGRGPFFRSTHANAPSPPLCFAWTNEPHLDEGVGLVHAVLLLPLLLGVRVRDGEGLDLCLL